MSDIGSIKLYAGLSVGVGKTQSIFGKKYNMLFSRLMQDVGLPEQLHQLK
jgi:hypothetical protein